MTRESHPAAAKVSREGLFLGALLAAAALLRFSGLARQSLWVDEVLSMRGANRILSLDAAAEIFNVHGPLYFYVLAPALRVEPSEVAARLPSAILGVALVGMVYLLGRDLVDRRTGLGAAAVTAFSPFALWYSQEVRYVSLYLLLSAASAWTAVRFLQRGTLREGVLHVVSSMLMLLAFPAGIFVCLGENLWALAARPGAHKLGKWILGQCVIAIVFVPWLVHAHEINKGPLEKKAPTGFSVSQMSSGFSRPLKPIQVGYPLFTFGAGLTIGPSNRELHEDLSLRPILRRRAQVFSAILITGAMAAIGSLVLLGRTPSGGILLLLLVVTSLLGPYVIAQFSSIAYNVRYTAGGFPAYMVLLGAAAAWAFTKKPWGWGLLAAFMGLTAFSLAAYFGNSYYFRDDNRGAARFVAERVRPGEPVVVGAEERAFLHYFQGPITSWRRWRVDSDGSGSVERAPYADGTFWVAANRTWEEPGFQEFLGAMQKCFPVETEAEFPGYRVYAFRAGAPRAPGCSLTFQRSRPRPLAQPAAASRP